MTEVPIDVAIAAEMQEGRTPVGLLFMDQKAVAGAETFTGQNSFLIITCCLTPCMHVREHGQFW